MFIVHRLVGLGLIIAAAITGFFVIAPGMEQWIGIVLGLVIGVGVCQAAFGFTLQEAAAIVQRQVGWRQRVLPSLVLIAGMLPSVVGILHYVQKIEVEELRSEGVITKAEVVEVYSMTSRKGGKKFHASLKFKDTRGQSHTVEEEVTRAESEVLADSDDPVEIIYSPKHPKVLDVLLKPQDRKVYGK